MLLNLPIDGILLTAWGIISIIAGFRNKSSLFLLPISHNTVLKDFFGENYNKIINISGGILFIMIGLMLFFRQN